ncbi:MAG TPA: response regulator transcription factor [Acidimicrobiales bacterium]|nr:response regulator transcription factor [Acidimicrobiales bacterium]
MPDAETPVRVLVVDDEPDIRILLWLAVEADGRCQVVADASNGREGVVRAAEHQPDVVVLDQMMPEMDGVHALPLIREAAPRAKVIMLSALSSQELRAEALRSGADAYLEKSASFRPVLDLAVNLARGHGPGAN